MVHDHKLTQWTRGCPRARCWVRYSSYCSSKFNDLPSVLDPGTAVRLFADDCLVYRSIDSEQDQLLLQQDLDALNLWGQCWGMRFNTKKCQVMHIGKQSRHHFYQLNNEILTTATEVKYLGITLTNDLKWSTHVKQTSTKAHQRLGFVKRNLKGSPYKHREMAYTSLVRSPMEYCGAIWDQVSRARSHPVPGVVLSGE